MVKFRTSTESMYEKNKVVDTLKKRSNESLTDTKGFIPLNVQIKRYLLAGVRLKTMREQYTCEDYLEAYKDIDCITEDMDIVEIQEAVQHVNEILESRRLARVGAESPGSAAVAAAALQKAESGNVDAETVDSVVADDEKSDDKE